MSLQSASRDLLLRGLRGVWERPLAVNLRPLAGELLLGVLCRLLRDPLNSRVVARYLDGAGLFPTDRFRYATRLGMRMKLNLHDRIPRLIYFLNCHEPNETSVVRRIVQPDWTVLDVGAHIGYYTLLMARLLDRCRGRVYAFEPNPETFAILKEHVEMNELTHVTALNLALGASVGYAELYLGPSHHSGPASMFPPACAEKRVAAEVSTLEEFVADSKLNRLDFIKMDVNGAEPDVLRGGREALAFYRPRMLMEVNPPMLAQSGRRPRDLLLLLRDLGYAVFRTDRPRSEITLSESGRLGYMYVYCEPR